jgi:hypothetical protein
LFFLIASASKTALSKPKYPSTVSTASSSIIETL